MLHPPSVLQTTSNMFMVLSSLVSIVTDTALTSLPHFFKFFFLGLARLFYSNLTFFLCASDFTLGPGFLGNTGQPLSRQRLRYILLEAGSWHTGHFFCFSIGPVLVIKLENYSKMCAICIRIMLPITYSLFFWCFPVRLRQKTECSSFIKSVTNLKLYQSTTN